MKPSAKEIAIHPLSQRTPELIQQILEQRVPKKIQEDEDRMQMCYEIMAKIPSAKLRVTKGKRPFFVLTFKVEKNHIIEASLMPTYIASGKLKLMLRWPFPSGKTKQNVRTYNTVDACLAGILKHSKE